MQRVEVTALRCEPPPALQGWSPQAERMWQAIVDSPVTRFYESTDWQHAQLLCEVLTEWDETRKISLLAEVRYLSGLLMLTEADRRRAHIEIERVSPEPRERPSDVAKRRLGVLP